ncbi:MAG TPA: dual specificity protein phosphatase family protein [Acidobacteriota bacterium]|nr:dual specificity protein phosphatase family protein [Acidobacteriota bacterium]
MRHFNNVLTRVFAATLLVALGLAGPSIAQDQKTTISKIKIDNFGRISDSFYRGAQPKGQDYSDLALLGIKTIVNLTSDDVDVNEKAMVEKAGMKYIQIPMTTHEPPTPAKISQFLGILKNPESTPIYLHCVGGKHRTGVMTALYRMTDEGWTADQAFKEMKQYKFGADFLHKEFKNFVYTYYTDLAKTLKTPVEPAVIATVKASN